MNKHTICSKVLHIIHNFYITHNYTSFERDNDYTLTTSNRNIIDILTSEARQFLNPELFKQHLLNFIVPLVLLIMKIY
ncbi:hypothetical protein [Ehrlichia ruminantium]|uniref:Uncharacterized protein n=1 Tax=Ehrlichia ruminantium (strain Welgevonden) TaxID=254945 RepID=A0A0H3LZV2_EHRRW|nr:hypothetical protein [Ehrlichia ruminantium]QLK55357.1 hypothetical protein FDZ62_03810 [Ehrlichia ruminantium]QLK56274.1 hypothetical protein FDZ61_03805 [Ehrlichia ruminantium]UOD99478.1 hypothetical protein IMW62_03775 [Ehrlichia ruminantium]CAI27205.1 Hypothetical protein ERWE_CDS_07110 [Ehrlichia ruminantium str. Welgevonden]